MSKKEVILKSGRKVTLRPDEPLVRDIVAAKRTAKGDDELIPFVMTALYLRINGEPASLDDVLEMTASEFEKVSLLLPGVEDFISGQEK